MFDMNILSAAWRYWKWLCVALTTSFAVLFLLAAIVTHFKSSTSDKDSIGRCIDSGGTWDDENQACKAAA